jgi:hypothetical protein
VTLPAAAAAGDQEDPACWAAYAQFVPHVLATAPVGDHPDFLTAASTLLLTLDQLGEREAARALGEDTLPRCRRVLGPDHVITRDATVALTHAMSRSGDVKAARAPGPPPEEPPGL